MVLITVIIYILAGCVHQFITSNCNCTITALNNYFKVPVGLHYSTTSQRHHGATSKPDGVNECRHQVCPSQRSWLAEWLTGWLKLICRMVLLPSVSAVWRDRSINKKLSSRMRGPWTRPSLCRTSAGARTLGRKRKRMLPWSCHCDLVLYDLFKRMFWKWWQGRGDHWLHWLTVPLPRKGRMDLTKRTQCPGL